MKPPLAYLGIHRDDEIARLTFLIEKKTERYVLEYFSSEDISRTEHKEAGDFLRQLVGDVENKFQKVFIVDPISDGTSRNRLEVQGPIDYKGPSPFLGVLGIRDK